MQLQTVVSVLSLALISLATPQDGGFTNILGGSPDCNGASVGGYCCKGSILAPKGLFNNNDSGLEDAICCLGDDSHDVNSGPANTSCTSGSAVPLTDVATGGRGASTASRTSARRATSPSSAAEVTTTSTSTTTTAQQPASSSDDVTISSTQSVTAGASPDASTSPSTAGAMRAMMTAAPALMAVGPVVLAML